MKLRGSRMALAVGVAAAFTFAFPAAAATIGYWRFEGNADDCSGNGRHATPIGTPAYNAAVPTDPVPRTGTPNASSAELSPGGNYFAAPGLDLSGGSLTVECWIMFHAIGYNYQTFVSQRLPDAAITPAFHLHRRYDSDCFAFSVRGSPVGDPVLVESAVCAAVNTWYHLAGVYDHQERKQRIYVDGQLRGEADNPIGVVASTEAFLLGAGQWKDTDGDFWDGCLDEVRITRAALRPSEMLLSAPPSLGLVPAGFDKIVLPRSPHSLAVVLPEPAAEDVVVSFACSQQNVVRVEPNPATIVRAAGQAQVSVSGLRPGSAEVVVSADGYQPASIRYEVALEGDINGDGCVNVADLLSVRNSMGKTSGPALVADVAPAPNGDGIVNVSDLLFVRNHLGTGPLCR